ncbi:sigma-54-dependent Fis family transcriptional regulator [Desulfosediminicola ganghwensis]|uniref:sigma-54-dependent Fis family transcriptional regulator n=1 Tax=Desulfosediminicola ganghwensis TaxID=2569540 RepID=UPI0010ACCE38|nr:sigma-54-dependent Fis family transcriptional regulator [Desulfosediminicola ganghwensis]
MVQISGVAAACNDTVPQLLQKYAIYQTMFNNTSKQLIAQQWQQFCAGEEFIADHDGIKPRDFVFASWRRSLEHGVDPFKVEPARIAAGRLSRILKSRSELIRISLPVIENLYSTIEGSRSIIILSDEEGIILFSVGDTESLEGNLAYGQGVEYSEKTVGTNGVGTALYLNEPVQIWAEEHFAQRNHGLSCSAAPVHDPEGKIIGCLNLSCLWDKVHTHTLGMVKAAVSAIEQQLKIELVLKNKVALLQEKQGIFELIQDGLLTIDRNLRITDINEKARGILELTDNGGKVSGGMVAINEHIIAGIDFKEIVASGKRVQEREATLRLSGGALVHCLISATPITTSEGLVITLREVKSVRRMVNRYVGSKAVFTFDDIVGTSPQLMESVRLAKIAGESSTNTLILGESGTGKEMFAQAIHNGGERCGGPFVAVNCGALPRELLQSELFGYAQGAFTGAGRQGNPGKFELADGGTIFLDEIGEMPLAAQVNLLRVVERKEVVRVGGKYARPVDVRIIAATNSRLMQAISENTFREDLYYRLNVLTVNLPPLRLRIGDLGVLIEHFLAKVCRGLDRDKPLMADGVMEGLRRYNWPGNIRQLENIIERAVHVCQGGVITVADLSREITDPPPVTVPVELALAKSGENQTKSRSDVVPAARTLQNSEYQAIVGALNDNRGNIRRTAQMLGVARSTLYEKLRKYRIDISAHR